MMAKEAAPRTPRHTKTVDFSPIVKVRLCTLTASDYTQEEIAACWYTEEERREIRRSAMETVKMMMDGERVVEGDTQTNACSIRGLEHLTKQGAALRKQNRNVALLAVLDEQDRQFLEEEEFDERAIATAYSRQTAHSRSHAYMLGLVDQFYSQETYDSDTSTMMIPINKNFSNNSDLGGWLLEDTRRVLKTEPGNRHRPPMGYSCCTTRTTLQQDLVTLS